MRWAVYRQYDGNGVRGDRFSIAEIAGSPAPYEERDRFTRDSGRAVMNLIEQEDPHA